MLKNIINSKILSIWEHIYITYFIFLTILLPSLPIFFGFSYFLNKNIYLNILLNALIYLIIYMILQKAIYNSININIRIIISYIFLIFILLIPYFSYFLLFIPIMYFTRKLNLKDTIHFSLELMRKRVITILFVYILNILIISLVLSGIILLKLKFSGVTISTKDEILGYIFKNTSLLTFYSAINFSISSFLLYKNFEQNDIIRGDIDE